jgi:hypothetical protein
MNTITTHQSSKQVYQIDSFEKGQQFEKYIIDLFNENFFKVIKWRKAEKFPDGSYDPNAACPDLELVFMGKRNHRFAVECKWRKKFDDGKIQWATNFQVCSYEAFENRIRIPVFVAIGIGGEACNPERLFVTPLCNISYSTTVYENDLIPYKRKTTHRFFYNTCQLKLF